MSKYNKVNPGIYTQRGRLTPDEAARERRKQGETSPARTAQPMSSRAKPASAPTGEARRAAKATAIKRTKTTTRRQAVLARNAGGRAAPRPAAGRRKQ